MAAQLQAKMRKARQRPALSEEVEAVIACLGDDAATLRDAGEHEEVAMNMDDAARLLEAAYSPTPADAASEADPKPGEIWHVILKGASSVFTAKVNDVTAATVLLQKPDDYYETRYVRSDVRFVECADQRERQQGAGTEPESGHDSE